MKRIERVKLYPTPQQVARLQTCLDICREVYNVALQQRRDVWRTRGRSISHRQQYRELTELRKADPRIDCVYRELLDAALHKLDLAFHAFFRWLKHGQTPGYPRFRAARRYNSLEYPHGDRALKFNRDQSKIRVPTVGSIGLRRGRRIPAFGRAMIVRSPRGWFALFECEHEVRPLPATGKAIGIDVGVACLYADSHGHQGPNLRVGQRKAARVARLQRIVAKRHNGGQRRRNAVKTVARAQYALRWARRDWHHKVSRTIVNAFDAIALEKLRVPNLTRSAKGDVQQPGRQVKQKAGLNRAILDAAWSQFAGMIVAKAEEAGRRVVFVDPRHTSQTCLQCGHISAARALL